MEWKDTNFKPGFINNMHLMIKSHIAISSFFSSFFFLFSKMFWQLGKYLKDKVLE